MCHYCGCRQMPLIRDYVAEHESVMDLGGNAVRAIERGDFDLATKTLTAMAEQLDAHWRGEENGIFTVMAQEGDQFAAYIEPLVAEHRELAELLATVDVTVQADQKRIRDAVAELHEHILREEDGLFPASLIALSGAEWNTAIDAWQEAHPGQSLITD